ncbi:MAG: hypothetical protein IPN76_21260 [Saprospiraceae bacterium]|nr:hypothetical protein [Saprospiraceae bacterium]
MNKQLLLILLFLLTFTFSCKKDVLEPLRDPNGSATKNSGPKVELSEAMAFFQAQRQSLSLDAGGVSTRSVEDDVLTPYHFNPTWMGARHIRFANSLDMLAVPVQDSLSNEYMPGSISNMLFFRDSLDGLHVRLFVMVPEPNYASSVNGNYSTQDFTGFSFQLNEEGTLGLFNRIENGIKTHRIQVTKKGTNPFSESVDERGCPWWWPWCDCYDFRERGRFFKKIYKFLGDLFGNLFGSGNNPGGAYEQDGDDGIVLTLSDWPPPGNTNNQGGSGGSIFSQDFQNDIFFENTFHYQMSECMGMFSESDPPLIHQLSGHITDWDDQFLLAVNYDLEQILNGGVANFAEALLIEYDDDPTINIFHHLPHYNPPPQVTEALSKVYEKMIMKYKACDNQYDMGGAGAELFDPEFCECVGDYSVKEGLNDFFNNLAGVGTEEFVELFPIATDIMAENPDLELKTALLIARAEEELGEYDIENNPPSTTGWLNCESFAFLNLTPTLYVSGVDNLFFSWFLPNHGITKTVGPFSIDLIIASTAPLDDITSASAWSANRAGKLLSYIVAAEPYLSESQVRGAFVATMKKGYKLKSETADATVTIEQSSGLPNRASAIYTNFLLYILSCL